ncbi:MAG: hypothetical protein FWD40_02140 [Treponema sp.]|nr:hypothetical protein [Treponema sp.]
MFEWKGGTNWITPGNWRNVTTGEESAARFPNGIGDTAIINTAGYNVVINNTVLSEGLLLDSLVISTGTDIYFNGIDVDVSRLVINSQFVFRNVTMNATTTELNSNMFSNAFEDGARVSTVNLVVSTNTLQVDNNNFTMDGAGILIGGSGISITRTGAALSVGSIDSGGRVVTVSSNQNITFTGDISAQRLLVYATSNNAESGTASGNVTVNGSVNINTAIVGPSPFAGCTGVHSGNVSMYVKAQQFRAFGGTGVIDPAPLIPGQLCLNVSGGYLISDSDGKVAGTRFHACVGSSIIFTPEPRHIVYGPSDPGNIPSPYLHINSADALGASVLYSVASPYNIYIVNVGNTSPANTRSADFIVNGSGYIEIRGNYTSSGNLNLSPGAGGLRLDAAVINLTGNAFDASYPVTLAGAISSITASSITLGNVTGTNNNLTLSAVSGVVTLGGALTGVGNLTITSLLTNINNNITTAGNQIFNSAISLGGIVSPRVLTAGGFVQTSNTISGSMGLTVTANNDITIGAGGLNIGTANILRLNSITGNIDILGNITNTNRLIMQALGTVTVAGNATINVSSDGNHETSPGDGTGSAIYVRANTFNAPSGSGIIYPGPGPTRDNGEICLDVINFPGDGNGRINGVRFHLCSSSGTTPYDPANPPDKHIVYYTFAGAGVIPADSDLQNTAEYYFIHEDGEYIGELIRARAGRGIYIVDVTATPDDLTFDTSDGTGFIEFRRNYTSSHDLTLNAGTGVVRFTDNVNINIGSNDLNAVPPQPFPTGLAVNLTGTAIITASNVRLLDIGGTGTLNVFGNLNVRSKSIVAPENIVNIDAQNISLIVSQDVSFGPDNLPGPALPTTTLNAVTADSITLRAPVTTVGNQTYGTIVLFSNSPNLAIREFTSTGGGTISLGTVSSWNGPNTTAANQGDVALRINGNAVFNGAFSTATTSGANSAAGIRFLHVTGTSRINVSLTVSGADGGNSQFYGGNVELGGNVTLTGSAGNAIRFNGTVNGIAAESQNLEIATSNAWFGQAVGGSVPLSGLSVAGTTQMNASITTNGNQTYTGTVTLGGTGTNLFAAGATGNVLFSNTIVGGARPLVVTGVNVTFNGNIGAAAAGTRLTSVAVTATGTITIGTTTTAVTIFTSGAQTFNGNITLANNATFNANAGALVRFNNTVNGIAPNAQSLTITGANAHFEHAVGSTAALTSVSVAGTTQMNASITTNGNQTYTGAVILGDTAAPNLFASGTGTVLFSGTITGASPLEVTGANVTFSGNIGADGTRLTSVAVTTTTGTITIGTAAAAVTVFTSGNQTFNGNITFLNNAALSSTFNANATAGNTVNTVRFNGTVNGTRQLIVTNANAQFDGIVGGGTALTSVTVDGTSVINANITTTGNQAFNGTVEFGEGGAAARRLSSSGGNITASGIVSRAATLTGPVEILASQGISIGAVNTLGGDITLNNNQGATPAGNITFGTTAGITLSAINSAAAGDILINQSGSLEITSLQTASGRNITLGAVAAVGAVTQTGTITSGTLIINSSAGVILNQDNSVNTLSITGAGAAVEFVNNTALAIAPISGVNNNDVSITVNGVDNDITQTGLVTSVGVLRYTTQDGDVNIEASINAQRLIINADGRTVTVEPLAGINVSSLGNHDSPPGEGLGAAIYVHADTFNAIAGPLNIIPGPASPGELCLNVVYFPGDGNGRVNRYHWHIRIPDNKDVFFGSFPIPIEFNNTDFYHINSDTFTGNSNIAAGQNRDIYIVNAENNMHDLTFVTTGTGFIQFQDNNVFNGNVTLETASTGFIQFRDNNVFDGNVTLTPLTNPIRLNNANVSFNADFNGAQNFNMPVLLIGSAPNITANTIRAQNITLGSVTSGGTANDLALIATAASGNVFLNAAINANVVRNLNLTANGNITISNIINCAQLIVLAGSAGTINVTPSTPGSNTVFNINTTGGSAYDGRANVGQYYNRPVVLNGTFHFRGVAGTLIWFKDIVTHDLPGNNRRMYVSLADLRFEGNVTMARLDIGLNAVPYDMGTIYINTPNITATQANNNSMRFRGPVILEQNVTFTTAGAAANPARFFGTVDSAPAGGPFSLTVSNVGANFHRQVGGTNALLSVTTNNASVIVAGVRTTGNQTYTTGDVTISGQVGNGATGGGAAQNTGANVTFNATGENSTILFGGAVNNAADQNRALTVTSDNIRFNGNIGAAGNGVLTTVTATSNNAAAGSIVFGNNAAINIFTSGNQTYNGVINLNGNAAFTGGAAGTVLFNGTVNGFNATARTLTIATAAARFDGNVGAGNPVQSVQTAAVTINANITTAAAQTYGTVTLQATDTVRTLTGTAITLGAITGNGQSLIINGHGTNNASAQFNGAANTGIGNLTVNGATALNANVTFTGMGAAQSNIHFTGTVNSSNATARAFTITNANVRFDGNVGAAGTPIESLNVVANPPAGTAGTAEINSDITTTISQNYSGAVALGGAGTRTLISNTGSIRASGIVSKELAVTQVDISASQGIDLNNSANTLYGNIALNNNQTGTQSGAVALSTTGAVNVTGTNPANIASTDGNFTITANGDITVGAAGITAEGVIKLSSSSSGATINTTGAITGLRLELLAENGTVTIGSLITVSSGADEHDDNAAVLVDAANFNGAGNIEPGLTTGVVCVHVSASLNYTGNVTGERIHYHIDTNNNIVYRHGADNPSELSLLSPYFYLRADSTLGQNLFATTKGVNRNIYVIDITEVIHPSANSRNVTFETANGYIEFRDAYVSSGNLTLNPSGTNPLNGNIRLVDAGIGLSNAVFNSNGAVELAGTGGSVINAAGVVLGYITGNNNSLTINGPAGAANDDADAQLNGGAGIGALVINGEASFSASLLSANSVNVTGDADINANITTTANQTYGGDVTLGGSAGARTLTGTGSPSSTVLFSGTVNGARELVITNADVRFNGLVGNLTPLSGITVNATGVNTPGAAVINNNIHTSGSQNYNGEVELLGATRTITSTGGSVNIPSLVTGANGVTVNALQGISIDNLSAPPNTIDGIVSLTNTGTGNIIFTNTSNNLTLGANNSAASGNINVIQTGPLLISGMTIPSPNGSINLEASEEITQTGIISAGSLTLKSGSHIDLQENNTVGVLTVTGTEGDVQFANNAPLAIAGISGLSGASQNITITAAGAISQTGNITTNGEVVLSSGGNVSQNAASAIDAEELTVSSSGSILLGSLNSVNSVSLSNANTSASGDIIFNNDGTLTIKSANNASVNADINISSENGSLNIIGTATGIITGNGAIIFKSENYDISISGAMTDIITGYRLELLAENGTITIGDDASVGFNIITVTSEVFDCNIEKPAVSIVTDILEGKGGITPGAAEGHVCVHYITSSLNYTGNVAGDRIHYHIDTPRNIVYYIDESVLGEFPPANHFYIKANSTLGQIFGAETRGADTNIYIIGIAANNGEANTRDVTFKTANGFIEFRADYVSSGALNLDPAGGIRLVNADIVISGSGNSFDSNGAAVTLAIPPLAVPGTSFINAAEIDLGAITGGGNSLTLTGTSTLNGGSGINALQATGSVTLEAALSASSINVTGDAYINAGVSAGTVNITNNAEINANITTTADQTYGGAVTLGGAGTTRTLTGSPSSTVLFSGTVNGARELVITNADVRFNGLVGDSTPLSGITVNATGVNTPGAAVINNNIQTSGNQIYHGNVNLQGSVPRIITSTGGSVNMYRPVTGTNGVTVNALQGISMEAANMLTGIVTLNNNQAALSSGEISFNNSSTSSVTVSSVNNTNNAITKINTLGPLEITSLQTPGNGSITLGESPATVGELTQTGAITTGKLLINSTGAITLTEENNSVDELTVTGAAGNVKFTNNASLVIAGIGGLSGTNQDITITAEGAISQTGNMTTNGKVELLSGGNITQGTGFVISSAALEANAVSGIVLGNTNNIDSVSFINDQGDITFRNSGNFIVTGISNDISSGTKIILESESTNLNEGIKVTGEITGYRLELLAENGTVELESTPANANLIRVYSDGECHDEGEAPVYIFASNFTGTGGITLEADTGEVCVRVKSYANYTGAVTGDRIHYHIDTDKNIVYRHGADTDPLQLAFAAPYLYLRADSTLGRGLLANTTASAGKIFIIGINNIGHEANIRNVTFTTSGQIDIRGAYVSSGNFTLNSGADGIILRNAEIDLLDSGFNSNNSKLTLDGNSNNSIRVSSITPGNVSNIILGGGIYGTIGSVNNLILEGQSDISVTGTVGEQALRLGDISVLAGNIIFSASSPVYANSYVQNAGSAEFNRAMDYLGGFSFTGTSLSIADNAKTESSSFSFTGTNITLGNNSPLEIGSGGITINNSGTFNQGAGAGLTSAAAFRQTGSGNSNITTSIQTNGDISFIGPVNISESIAINSSEGDGDISFAEQVNMSQAIVLDSGNGDITFSSAVTGSGSLEVKAGSGDILVEGQVGSSAGPFGDITVTEVNDATFESDVYAGDITVRTANDVTFNSAVHSGDITVTEANDVTFKSVHAGDIDLIVNNASFMQIDAESFTIDNSRTYTQNGNVSLNNPFTQKSTTGTGDVSLGADITVTNDDKENAAIRFASIIELTENVTFTLPEKGGFIVLAEGTEENAYSITLAGGSTITEALEISKTAGTLNDITISTQSYVIIKTGDTIRQANSKTLTLETVAILNLVINDSSWIIGGDINEPEDLKKFTGYYGALILKEDTKLFVHDIYFKGISDTQKFSFSNTGNVTIDIKGDAQIADNEKVDIKPDDLPYLVFEMTGENPLIPQNLIADQAIGNLRITENSQTVLSTNNADKTIHIRGEVLLFPQSAPAGLEAGDHDIVLYAALTGQRNLSEFQHVGSDSIKYTRWEKYTDASSYPINPDTSMDTYVFRQASGRKVSFAKDEYDESDDPVFFEIVGHTVWREFECWDVQGATIQFSMHPHQHIVLEKFSIGMSGDNVDENNFITVTRLTENHGVNPYRYEFNKHGEPPVAPGDLGSYAIPVYPIPPNLKATPQAEQEKYWNISIIFEHNPVDPLGNFRNVRMYFSHSTNSDPIFIEDSVFFRIIPYYDSALELGYFNYNWLRGLEPRTILYSFTEDYTGEGRLNRIRVQTNYILNGNFTGFDVYIEGYEIERNRPSNDEKFNGFDSGFQLVSYWTKTEFDRDSFYIYLKPKLEMELDTGSTPVWSVRNNPNLRDTVKGIRVGVPGIDIDIKPFDTIPPRIKYTLTLPGHDETYVRMSEAVEEGVFSRDVVKWPEPTIGYTFTWQYLPIERASRDFSLEVNPANLGYLLGQNPLGITELFNLDIKNNVHNDQYFRINNMVDQGQRAMDWSDRSIDGDFSLYYKGPKYPLNWGYTEYARVTGNSHLRDKYPEFIADEEMAETKDGVISIDRVFMPPNKLLTVEMMDALANGNGHLVTPDRFTAGEPVIRRVTDVLVSIPPTESDSENYFAWPVWVRDEKEPNPEGFNDNNGEFWGQINTDTAIIWDFDGTKYLERSENLIIQVRLNNALNYGLNLLYGFDVDVKHRNPAVRAERGTSAGGLWLADSNVTAPDFYPNFFMVPKLFSTEPVLPQASASSLFTYRIDSENFSNGGKFEFLLRLQGIGGTASYLSIARLDIPRGAAIPANWYTLVRPFSFDIQNIRLQRGGVTILNNVINSDAREVTYLRYNLLRPGRVTIQVHTLDGTLVRSIRRNEYREKGEYTDAWDGTNNSGRPVARGMYFIRVVGPDIDEIRKVMVVR